jgi:polysaccharide export outer membrane protein
VPGDSRLQAPDGRLQALSALPRSNAEYRLGPGDLIEIGVFGVNEFRHTVRIAASGIIKLPLIEPVTASGLTAAELEQRLTLLLGDEVIKNPQVSVFVKEYRSQPIYVLGAVRNPGQYQVSLQLRIVDALSLAGGLLATAVDEAVIQRPTPTGGEETIHIDLQKLLETGDLSLNVPVQGGDVIHVRERVPETVYVVGEVNRAGAYIKPPKTEWRVSQVIAWAGGPMKTAKLAKGILVRYGENGTREELPVNFNDILKGKADDFFVRANDVIFVPGSTIKNLGYGVLNGLPGTVATLPYRIP